TSSTAQALLDTALLHAITLHKDLSSAPPAPVQVPRKGQGHPYQVLFSPISQRTESVDLPKRAACIALIHDQQPIQHADLSTALIQAYELSKAEARVCKALLSGKSAQEAAVALNISRNTVKTHLARIFHKTGVHSQTALLQLMTTRWKPGA
ncbi:MAG: helix-turn-helix transcriptional regulator, partial [Gammaproteobacteria bacterium]|nr:helix-turn-helix transcriptional regulator [Gammaproteobacteria bacterium]